MHLAGRGIEQLVGIAEIVVGVFPGERFLFTRTAIPVVQPRRRIAIRPTE
jgi:hypothetical protein